MYSEGFGVGDRVRIVLTKPYTEEEITELGCDPDVNNKTGRISKVIRKGLYAIDLDEIQKPNKLYENKVYYDQQGYDRYNEYHENLQLIDV